MLHPANARKHLESLPVFLKFLLQLELLRQLEKRCQEPFPDLSERKRFLTPFLFGDGRQRCCFHGPIVQIDRQMRARGSCAVARASMSEHHPTPPTSSALMETLP